MPTLKAQGVESIVLLIHQGGQQNPPAATAGGFPDVNTCQSFSGADMLDVMNRLDAEIDVVVSAHTHQPYICRINGRLVTSAASFGRVVTEVTLKIDRATGEVESATGFNHVVAHDTIKDAATTAVLAPFRTAAAPIANRVIGRITADIRSSRDVPSGQNAAGEQPMGDVIADAMLEATSPSDFGGAVAAFMNVGGVRGGLIFSQISGGEAPGEVTYAEAFTVQPFGNTLVVKDCTGAQLKAVLEQQFNNPAAGQNRIMAVSANVSYTWSAGAAQGAKVSNLRIGGALVVPGTTYRVAMNNFIADGGDGFSVFTTCTNPLGGEVDIDAFARYLTAHSPLAPPPLNRITMVP